MNADDPGTGVTGLARPGLNREDDAIWDLEMGSEGKTTTAMMRALWPSSMITTSLGICHVHEMRQ